MRCVHLCNRFTQSVSEGIQLGLWLVFSGMKGLEIVSLAPQSLPPSSLLSSLILIFCLSPSRVCVCVCVCSKLCVCVCVWRLNTGLLHAVLNSIPNLCVHLALVWYDFANSLYLLNVYYTWGVVYSTKVIAEGVSDFLTLVWKWFFDRLLSCVKVSSAFLESSQFLSQKESEYMCLNVFVMWHINGIKSKYLTHTVCGFISLF